MPGEHLNESRSRSAYDNPGISPDIFLNSNKTATKMQTGTKGVPRNASCAGLQSITRLLIACFEPHSVAVLVVRGTGAVIGQDS